MKHDIPKATCDCGKPVVFLGKSKRFVCTRCGARWRLVIKVECYRSGDVSFKVQEDRR